MNDFSGFFAVFVGGVYRKMLSRRTLLSLLADQMSLGVRPLDKYQSYKDLVPGFRPEDCPDTWGPIINRIAACETDEDLHAEVNLIRKKLNIRVQEED